MHLLSVEAAVSQSGTFTADAVLSPYIYVFYAAFIVSFIFTPVMRLVASYYGVVDQPDKIRKTHREPVAYLGGIALFLGWLCGLAVSQFLQIHRRDPGWGAHPIVNFSIVVGAMLIVALGLWDDINGVKPRTKILVQVAGALMLLADGVGRECTRPMIEPVSVRLVSFFGMDSSSITSYPFWFMLLVQITSGIMVIMVVVGCCNATNLMDGMDGLCGGVTAIIAAGFLFVAVHLATFGGGLNTNWDALRVIMGLAILGAVLGFVPYNFNPASIFMGDTGSMFLGYGCAVMILLLAQERAKWFLAAMVMFALPILDTTLAFARRWIAGRPLFSADAQHFHHQLVQRGFSVKQTVLISYGLAIVFAILGTAVVFTRTRYAVAIYLVTFGSIVVAAYKLGMVHERTRIGSPARLGDAPNEAAVDRSPGAVFVVPDEAATAGDSTSNASGSSVATMSGLSDAIQADSTPPSPASSIRSA